MEIYSSYSKQRLILEANLAASDREPPQGERSLVSVSMKTLLPSRNHWAGRSHPRLWGTRIPLSRDEEKGEAEFRGGLGFQLAFLPTKACRQEHLERGVKWAFA